MVDLSKRSLLTLLDFTPGEIGYLLDLAARLKADKYIGKEKKTLQGKNIVLLFEKDSTRTRCSFEVAAYDQGARVTYLGPTGSQMGKKESLKDTARVLGRNRIPRIRAAHRAHAVRILGRSGMERPDQ